MATDENLSAAIRVRDHASGELRDIAESFRDVARTAAEAGASARSAAEGFDEAGDEASGLSKALGSLSSASSTAAGSLSGVAASSEAGEEGLEDVRQEARGLNTQLAAIPATAAAAAASMTALGAVEPEMDVDTDVDTDIPTRMSAMALGAVPDIQGTIRRLRERVPTIELGTEVDTGGLQRALRGLPEMEVDIGDADDLDALQASLQQVSWLSDDLTDTLSGLDDDEIIRDADSVDDLSRSLRRANVNSKATERSLDELSEESREMVDDVVAGSASVRELEDEIGDLGNRSSVAASRLDELGDETRELVAEQAAAITSSHKLAGAIDEVGDEATESAAELTTFKVAQSGVFGNMADTTTSLGPFTTSLSSVAALIPVLASLAAALGSVATAAVGAGGALAGIFGGGLLALGENITDQMVATGEASEEMMEAEGSEKALLGLQELLSDLKEAAYEALEPLRQPEFAEFSLDILEGAITLLGRLSEGIASISGPVMEGFDMIGDAFWSALPEIGDEMVHLLEDIGPLLQGITIGAIERIPWILDLMRQHGEMLIPLLMDFGAALMDAMPALMEIGTLMLRGILPNLTGFLKGIAALTPAITLFARVVGDVIHALDPLIELIFAVGGVAMVAANAIPFLVWSLSSLAAVTKLLLIGPIISSLKTLAAVAGIAAKAVGLLVGAVGTLGAILTGVGILVALGAIISYFDLWDDLIAVLIAGWNTLLKALQAGQGILGGAVEAVINTAIEGINTLIKAANEIPGVDMGTIDFRYEAEDIGNEHFVDPAKAEEWGALMPGQDNDGYDPLQGSRQSTAGPGKPGQTRRDRRQSGGDTYNYNFGDMYMGEDADERRIREAVRQGVRKANQRQRRKTSSMN